MARNIGLRILMASIVAAAPCTPAFGQSDASSDGEAELRTTLDPAKFDETLAIGGEELDAEMLASRMTVDVTVNEQGPYKFVVDSGADTSVVGQRLASRLDLPSAPSIMLNAMTETTRIDRVSLDRLRLGSTTFEDLQVPILKERDIGAHGMIGLDALADQRLMMDFENRVITVSDTREPLDEDFKGEIVVTARLQRGQLILTEVEAGRHPIDAVIDTGTEISIGNSAMKEMVDRQRMGRRMTVEIAGVTGEPAELEVVVVKELTLGSIRLYNVAIAFADVPPFGVFGLAEKPALLLGTDVMEQFRKVSLDFGERKVRFQLKRCEKQRVQLSTHTSFASRLRNYRTRMEARKISACAR